MLTYHINFKTGKPWKPKPHATPEEQAAKKAFVAYLRTTERCRKCNRLQTELPGKRHKIEFHHIDEKRNDIGKFASGTRTVAQFIRELNKCCPLCTTCHGKFHRGTLPLPHDFIKFNFTIQDVLKFVVS